MRDRLGETRDVEGDSPRSLLSIVRPRPRERERAVILTAHSIIVTGERERERETETHTHRDRLERLKRANRCNKQIPQ